YGASCHDARSLVQSLLLGGPGHYWPRTGVISKYRKVTSAGANGIRRIRSVGRNIRWVERSLKKKPVQYLFTHNKTLRKKGLLSEKNSASPSICARR
ncbi:hypothetical protein, partial [Devosia sp.]|uniref:hypothetical protein n=1 Tax=Devosia sp. TaxID=1871048 RepID=UPI002AFE2F71